MKQVKLTKIGFPRIRLPRLCVTLILRAKRYSILTLPRCAAKRRYHAQGKLIFRQYNYLAPNGQITKVTHRRVRDFRIIVRTIAIKWWQCGERQPNFTKNFQLRPYAASSEGDWKTESRPADCRSHRRPCHASEAKILSRIGGAASRKREDTVHL